MNNKKGWIGVDLDGTLAYYDHWRGDDHIGKPIPLMVRRVKELIAKDYTVKVFTARMYDPGGRDMAAINKLIGDWTLQHIGTRLQATNVKDFAMIQLYDDRAIQVVLNTGRIVISSKKKDK